MLKIINWGGGWGAKARIRAADGSVLQDIKTKAE